MLPPSGGNGKKHKIIKTTPHNPRLTPLHVICLHFFRHSTQIFLAGRQPACVKFMHSDEKTDFTSDAQGLCSIALKGKYIMQEGSCKGGL